MIFHPNLRQRCQHCSLLMGQHRLTTVIICKQQAWRNRSLFLAQVTVYSRRSTSVQWLCHTLESSNGTSAFSLQKRAERVWRTHVWDDFRGQSWKWHITLLPTFHSLELSHVTALNCKSSWEIKELLPSEEGVGLVSNQPVSGPTVRGLVETVATMDIGQPKSPQETSYA